MNPFHSLPSVVKRELRVMFNRRTQSVGVRLTKYALIGLLIYFFGKSTWFWWLLTSLLLGGLALHFFYRYQTRGWTRSYGRGLFRWDHDRMGVDP